MARHESLDVYQLSRELNKQAFSYINSYQFGRVLDNQFSRATLSISLNIAEGFGRPTTPDKRKFLNIARASSLECMAICDALEDLELLKQRQCSALKHNYERISKMLFSLIQSLDE